MELRYIFILIGTIATGLIVIPITYSTFASEHSFSETGNCLQCHSDIRNELDSSMFHANFTCESCHLDLSLNNSGPHGNIVIPSCISCHEDIVQSLNKDSHNSLILGASSSSQGENEACIACHSSVSNNITFKRSSYFEWDVVIGADSSWLIENLTIGANKDVQIDYENNNGNVHDISLDNGCINCHNDIKNAVISGGHSNEQWAGRHNYVAYSDMNLYCKSCHKPYTQNIIRITPYSVSPFNLAIHDSMTVSCIDCHIKPDLLANINGGLKLAPYNSGVMGSIEKSISEQPYNVQSYLCMACKNTGNPSPINGSLHFKIFTEPDTTIYVNIIATPTPTPTPTLIPTATTTPTPIPTATTTPTPTPTATTTPTSIPTATTTPTATQNFIKLNGLTGDLSATERSGLLTRLK